MKEFKSHKITVRGTLGVTAINVKTVEDVEKAVQQIVPADYSKVSTREGEYGIIETHETKSGEYRYILEYDGKNPYCAMIFDEDYEILGYVKITDEEIDEVAENYEKAQGKVVIIDGKLYGYEIIVKDRKVNCTLGRRDTKSVTFRNLVEITKEEAEEILAEYGFTVESYIAYGKPQNAEVSEEKVETVDTSADDAEKKAEETTDNKWEYSPNIYGNTGWQVWRHKFIYGGTVRITNAKDTDYFTVKFDEHYNNEISIRSLFSRLYVIEQLVPVFDGLKIYNNVHSGIEKINEKYNGWFVAEKGKENDTFNVTFRKCESAEIAKKAAFEVAEFVISMLTAEFEKIDTAVLKHFETMNEENEMALIPYVPEVEVEVQTELEIACSELKKLNDLKEKIGNEYDKTDDAEISNQLEEAYDYVVGVETGYLMKKIELEKATENTEKCSVFDKTAEEVIDAEFIEKGNSDNSSTGITDEIIGLRFEKKGKNYVSDAAIFEEMQIGDKYFDRKFFRLDLMADAESYLYKKYLEERAARYESAENALKNGLTIRESQITRETIGLSYDNRPEYQGYYCYCNFKAMQIGEKFFPERRIYVGASDNDAQYEIDARTSAAKFAIVKGLPITSDITPAIVCNSAEKPSDFFKNQQPAKENKDGWEVVRDSAATFDWTYYRKYPVEGYGAVEIKHAEDANTYSVSCRVGEWGTTAEFFINGIAKTSDILAFVIKADGFRNTHGGEVPMGGGHYDATFSKGTEEENKAAAFAYADYLVEFLSHFEKTAEGYILNQDYLREYIYGKNSDETSETTEEPTEKVASETKGTVNAKETPKFESDNIIDTNLPTDKDNAVNDALNANDAAKVTLENHLPKSLVRKKPNTAVKVNIRPAKARGRLFTRKPLNENINALKTA